MNGQDGITIGQAAPQPVRLVLYDDQSRASLARANALRLLRRDCVDALFGPYSSGLTMAVAALAFNRLAQETFEKHTCAANTLTEPPC